MLFNMFLRKKRLHLHFFMLWLFLVIQSEAKNLEDIHVYVTEIFRRYAPLNDISGVFSCKKPNKTLKTC